RPAGPGGPAAARGVVHPGAVLGCRARARGLGARGSRPIRGGPRRGVGPRRSGGCGQGTTHREYLGPGRPQVPRAAGDARADRASGPICPPAQALAVAPSATDWQALRAAGRRDLRVRCRWGESTGCREVRHTVSMRIYLPAYLLDLTEPAVFIDRRGHIVTAGLQRQWGVADQEEAVHAALLVAARDSVALLDQAGVPPRRV